MAALTPRNAPRRPLLSVLSLLSLAAKPAVALTYWRSSLTPNLSTVCARCLATVPLKHRRLDLTMSSSSWSSPDWRWGYANGAAHDAAATLRNKLRTNSAREEFLKDARSGSASLEELKLALALKWQRARNFGYDEDDWEAAMEDMAACKFEGPNGKEALAAALKARLPESSDESVDQLAVRSLEALQFVDRGL
eukprot:4955155-Pleurochrysis_carterae.AAC.2